MNTKPHFLLSLLIALLVKVLEEAKRLFILICILIAMVLYAKTIDINGSAYCVNNTAKVYARLLIGI